MSSFILFICGCLLGVLFLSTLYGDSLRLNGLFEGQWLSPLLRLIVRFFAGTGQLFDVTALFVLTHLSWVVATVSGLAGLALVLFLMGGGLAADAAAWQRDSFQPLNSGGVLDRVSAIRTEVPARLVSRSRNERDDSLMLNQALGGPYLVFNRPDSELFRPRQDLANEPTPARAGTLTGNARPLLDVTFQRLGSTSDQDAADQTSTLGELIESLPEPGFIDRALNSLGRDGWRESLGYSRSPSTSPNEGLPESTFSEIRTLESDIRVLPGAMVASHDIRVEKSAPTASESGEISMEISITNPGTEIIDGLLVREHLPRLTLVRNATPEPVFRDDTLTWLINDLRPSESRTLQFTVFPTAVQESTSDLLFESDTEVSALLAVTSPTQVVDTPSGTLPRNPVTPRPVGAADVRLTIDEPAGTPLVGEWTRIVFNVTNTGDLSASDLKLRLTLDDSLDHADLLDRPNDRQVYVSVKRLDPGETRSFRLEVRPMQPGSSISTAEVLSEGAQIGLEEFRLTARESAGGNE